MRSRALVNVTDEDLLEQLRSGVADALAVLFDRHYRLVFSVAHRILQDSAEAEELMQEVFLEVYRDAGKFDPARGSVKNWILQYAANLSASHARRLERRPEPSGIRSERLHQPRPGAGWASATPCTWRTGRWQRGLF